MLVAQGTLGRALLGLRRGAEAVTALEEAAQGADQLGNPYGRWRARSDLGRARKSAHDA